MHVETKLFKTCFTTNLSCYRFYYCAWTQELCVIHVWMICSVYHSSLWVAFQCDIPSPWRECWSANRNEMNACVIHSHMGTFLHMLEDGEREPARSWQWITECRLNKDGETGSSLKLELFETIADLCWIFQRLWRGSVWVSSISKAKVM